MQEQQYFVQNQSLEQQLEWHQTSGPEPQQQAALNRMMELFLGLYQNQNLVLQFVQMLGQEPLMLVLQKLILLQKRDLVLLPQRDHQ
jgi:hypothetical protein